MKQPIDEITALLLPAVMAILRGNSNKALDFVPNPSIHTSQEDENARFTN